jgi:hypothetical protein
MGVIIEAVKAQQLCLLPCHVAYHLNTHSLVGVSTATASSSLTVWSPTVQIAVLQGKTQGSTRDCRLTDLHMRLLSVLMMRAAWVLIATLL